MSKPYNHELMAVLAAWQTGDKGALVKFVDLVVQYGESDDNSSGKYDWVLMGGGGAALTLDQVITLFGFEDFYTKVMVCALETEDKAKVQHVSRLFCKLLRWMALARFEMPVQAIQRLNMNDALQMAVDKYGHRDTIICGTDPALVYVARLSTAEEKTQAYAGLVKNATHHGGGGVKRERYGSSSEVEVDREGGAKRRRP